MFQKSHATCREQKLYHLNWPLRIVPANTKVFSRSLCNQNQKKKMGVTLHFSEIIKLPF